MGEVPTARAERHPSRRRGPRRRWPDRECLLLDELERMFCAEGFAHLGVADLADRLRVSRSTLYRLATGKQELVELVIDRMFARMGTHGRAAAERAADPAARVAAYLGNGVAAMAAGSARFSRDLAANPGTRAVYDRHQVLGLGVLAELVEDGVRSGGFRPVPAALVAQVAVAAHARLRDPGVLADLGMTQAAAINALTGILLDGIAGRGAASPSHPAGPAG
jgi:AcrR family transcriptional regulator